MRKLAVLIAFLALPLHAAGYHVVRHMTVGGEGGWDYLVVDEDLRRLFVSHGTTVEVINLASGKVGGTIDNLDGVHGIALASDQRRGYISNGRAGTVTVFDSLTLKRLADWKATGENPDAILYDRPSGRVFTFNGRGKNITVFGARSGEVLATIPLEAKPEFAVSAGDGIIYVNLEDTSEIAEIDGKNAKVLRRWPLAPCEEPTGLAFDEKNDRLFSVCHNKLMAISDAKAGKVITTVPIGGGVDGVVFDGSKRVAISSNGADGTITVVEAVSPDTYRVRETVETVPRARTIALDGRSHHVFLPARASNDATFEVIEVSP
ncbi:MAG TPA: YncE family protein [Thermoanaerobaculia bacterium]|nr:YncE family protein [Thermoanaerobaculia bacterium]